MMTRASRIKQEEREKRKNIFRRIRTFLLAFSITTVFLITLGIIIIFHSPFTRIKDLIVTTSMTTMNHQYIAKLFVSDAEIKRIMDKNNVEDVKENTNEEEIHPIANKSDDIELVKISGSTYKGYLLMVKDPSRVSVGTTPLLGNKGMKVEEIVKEYNAIAGINAGGFLDNNGHGTGGIPYGILIEKGKMLNVDKSEKHIIIGFDKSNILVLGKYTLTEIKKMGIRDAVSFKPFLIVNGKPTITQGDGGWGMGPRTAIGQKKDGTILLLVIDGRQLTSIGATLKDVQDIMVKYGAHNAANLDGGSSTTLFYKNEIVNNPSSKYGARFVPSAFIVKK